MNASDFENELRKLRPAAPSSRLEEAIARDLAAPAPVVTGHTHPHSGVIERPRESLLHRLLSGLSWACGGAAVAVVAMLSLNPAPSPVQTGTSPVSANVPETHQEPENVFEPAESHRQLIATEDRGVIYTEEAEPTRIVRYNSMERHVWANPATGARVEVEVPREDEILLPVSFQ